jgi:predicted nucleic acid-binding protein
MRKLVFDTQALLKYYLDELGADSVRNYFVDVLERRVEGYINIVTLTELYYILIRVKEELAEEKERNLRSYGIKIVSLRDSARLWKLAAEIKARWPLSLADAFGAATAITIEGTLVTGADAEFDNVNKLRVERI